jgi:hypothetical protein
MNGVHPLLVEGRNDGGSPGDDLLCGTDTELTTFIAAPGVSDSQLVRTRKEMKEIHHSQAAAASIFTLCQKSKRVGVSAHSVKNTSCRATNG